MSRTIENVSGTPRSDGQLEFFDLKTRESAKAFVDESDNGSVRQLIDRSILPKSRNQSERLIYGRYAS